MLLGLFTCVWYLSLCVFLYMQHVLPMMIFFRAGRGIKVGLLLYCVIPAYDFITSKAIRVIWDVYSVLISYPYLRFCFKSPLAIIPSLWGRTGKDYFPCLFTLFSSFRPVKTAFEDFEFPLDVKECMCFLLGLPGLLSAVHNTFRITKEIF